jgi:hypothetical protein
MMYRLLPLLLALAAPLVTHAAESDAERGSRLRDEAKEMRDQADATYAETEAACYQRILVNRCIEQAKEARLKLVRESRALEAQAREIDLAEKRRAVEEREQDATRSASEPPSPMPVQATERVENADKVQEDRTKAGAAAASDAKSRQARKDAEKAAARAKAEAEAAKRAEQAKRDRARYDERLRKREAEQAPR